MSDELDKNLRDYAALVTRIASSLVPFVGGALGEVIVETIPRLRQDRIVEYLRLLNERIDDLERQNVKRILADEERIDLIEAGGHLAARATTSERISRIVKVVFRGLCAEQANFIRRKRLLGLLAEIDDDEFSLLNAYGQPIDSGSSEVWDAVNRPPPAHLGSSAEDVDNEKLYELGKQNLLRLGLLERKFDSVKKGEYPPFDAKSGGFKSRIQISYLGKMLLKEVGINLSF